MVHKLRHATRGSYAINVTSRHNVAVVDILLDPSTHHKLGVAERLSKINVLQKLVQLLDACPCVQLV